MKNLEYLLIAVSLLSPFNCSIECNALYQQPLSLQRSTLASIAKWQMKHFQMKEPFVAYNTLKDGILEIFGTAFGDEITSEKIVFLQELSSNFEISSVIFNWFYFDKEMMKIFDVFHKKIQNSVRTVIFKKCYFPKALVVNDSFELKHVTKASFIQCFANELSLKEIFKILKNASVTSLTISKACSYLQNNPVDSNVALKNFHSLISNLRIVAIDRLELHLIFPRLQFLSLSHCKINFDNFDLRSLNTLIAIDLSYSQMKILNRPFNLNVFPSSLQSIKAESSNSYNSVRIIESAIAQSIIIDNEQPLQYKKLIENAGLSVYTSFYMLSVEEIEEVTFANSYVQKNGLILANVTSVTVVMNFCIERCQSMLKLLSYLPNLKNLTVSFVDECNSFATTEEIRHLFSVLSASNIERLQIYFCQSKETFEFCYFIVELMKLCRNVSTLEFYYQESNLFASNIIRLIEEEQFHFTRLNSFAVEYFKGHDSDITIDLFFAAKYNIRSLKIAVPFTGLVLNDEVKDFNELDLFGDFQIEIFEFIMPNIHNLERNFIAKLFTKLPNLSHLLWQCHTDLSHFMEKNELANLKSVTARKLLHKSDIVNLLPRLPSTLESLEVVSFSDDVEDVQRIFFEAFPIATLIIDVK